MTINWIVQTQESG